MITYEDLSLENQQLIDTLIFISEISRRGNERPNHLKGQNLPIGLAERVVFLREFYAQDLASERPQHLNLNEMAKQGWTKKLLSAALKAQKTRVFDINDKSIRVSDLVGALGNLPYPDINRTGYLR